mgnify:CR=1 FL=1
MSTSQRTFDQVKSILGKLDRDIDAARERRLQQRLMPIAAVPQAPTGGGVFVPQTPALTAAPIRPVMPAPAPLPANDPGRSGYGRARPLRSDERAIFPPVQPRP